MSKVKTTKPKKAKKDEVQVIEGTHLTVTKHPNGRVEMKWDWDALLKEIVDATGIVPVTEAKVKATRKAAAKKPTKKKVK